MKSLKRPTHLKTFYYYCSIQTILRYVICIDRSNLFSVHYDGFHLTFSQQSIHMSQTLYSEQVERKSTKVIK